MKAWGTLLLLVLLFCGIKVYRGYLDHKKLPPPNTTTERHTRTFLTATFVEHGKPLDPYTNPEGALGFPGEPPIPEAIGSGTGSTTYDTSKHLSLLREDRLYELFVPRFRSALEKAKASDYRIPLADRRMLVTLTMALDNRGQLSPSSNVNKWLVSGGESGELVCIYQEITQVARARDFIQQSFRGHDGLLNMMARVNDKFVDPVVWRRLVVSQDGLTPVWRPATEEERDAVAPFEAVWELLEPVRDKLGDPGNWDVPAARRARERFLRLSALQQKACSEYIPIRHQYNLRDLFTRWLFDAQQSSSQGQ